MSDQYPLHLIAKKPNSYGFSGLDRSAHIREEKGWLDRLMTAPETRIVPVWRSRSLITDDASGNPCAGILVAMNHQALIEQAEFVVFLGEKAGVPHIGLDLSPLDEAQVNDIFADHGVFTDLRQIGPVLERFEGSILAYARGLMYWHQRHRFCGVCGAPSIVLKGGHQRNCTNETCRAPSFPRTDPAVIMLVHDGDRALLGRQQVWKPGMYSTLAGFVEPGETLEEAVAREVWEETNIQVEDVRYHSSQPWPFPASIMLGFHAKARTTAINLNDNEIEDAQWFTVDELRDFEAIGNILPRPDSIARRLIEDWMAELG
jgi:NAD+ diphosphatase